MKLTQGVLIALLVCTAAGCATIPAETVQLNKEVGEGLQAQHLALLEAVNLFFTARQQELDRTFEAALQRYFEGLGKHAPLTLDESKLHDMAGAVIRLQRQHQKKKDELQQARFLLERKLQENYLALLRANATVTASLTAAVDGDDARGQLLQRAGGESGLTTVFRQIDHWLQEPGDADESDLYNDVNRLLEPSATKEPQP